MQEQEPLVPEVARYIEKNQRVEKSDSGKLPLPTREQLSAEFLTLADCITQISGTWNPVELFTADKDSIDREKQIFFENFQAGNEYNPMFTYTHAETFDIPESREKLQEILTAIRQLKPGSHEERLARIALYYKVKDDLATCDFVEGIQRRDEEQIGRALKQKYPGTDPVLLATAQREYETLTQPSSEQQEYENALLSFEEQQYLKELQVADEDIKKAFQWALEQYEMLHSEETPDGFRVEISDQATSIDVRDKSIHGPTVFIPKGKTITGDKLLALMSHEIEGHARQSVNGERLFGIGGGALKIDNEMLYEGLGKRYDDRFQKIFFGTDAGKPLPYYAFAVHTAESGGSFYDIFQQQLQMRLHVALKVPPEEPLPQDIVTKIQQKAMDDAWLTTYRVMRGHTDTANLHGFAMAKDLAYLRGWLADKQLQENGFGHLNESAVIASSGLKLLAEFHLEEENLPIQFEDITVKYWEEIMKPEMKREQALSSLSPDFP